MPPKTHNFTRTEILAGLLVVASIAVLAGFVIVIQGQRVAEHTKTLHARFTNVLGMSPAAIVRFGGVQVGKVSGIKPDPKDHTQILVDAIVRADVPVNEKSIGTIVELSLTAERHLEISTGDKEAKLIADGGDIKTVTLSGSFVDIPNLDGVTKRVEDLLDDAKELVGVDDAKKKEKEGKQEFVKLTEVMNKVKKTLDQGSDTMSDVRKALDDNRPNLDKLLKQGTEIEDSAKQMVDQLNDVLKENRDPLKHSIADLDKVLKDANGIVNSVTRDIDHIIDSLKHTLDNSEGLTGTAKDFLDENRPQLESMMRDLQETLRYLKSFSQTLAQQPQAVIRGKAPEGRRE